MADRSYGKVRTGMRVYLQTRGCTIDYMWLPSRPESEWWKRYQQWTDFESRSVLVDAVASEVKFYVSDLPTSRQDRTGTSIRASLAGAMSREEGSSALIRRLLAFIQDVLHKDNDRVIQQRLDECFDGKWLEQSFDRAIKEQISKTGLSDEVCSRFKDFLNKWSPLDLSPDGGCYEDLGECGGTEVEPRKALTLIARPGTIEKLLYLNTVKDVGDVDRVIKECSWIREKNVWFYLPNSRSVVTRDPKEKYEDDNGEGKDACGTNNHGPGKKSPGNGTTVVQRICSIGTIMIKFLKEMPNMEKWAKWVIVVALVATVILGVVFLRDYLPTGQGETGSETVKPVPPKVPEESPSNGLGSGHEKLVGQTQKVDPNAAYGNQATVSEKEKEIVINGRIVINGPVDWEKVALVINRMIDMLFREGEINLEAQFTDRSARIEIKGVEPADRVLKKPESDRKEIDGKVRPIDSNVSEESKLP
jgi:hypothetical protein